MKEGSVVGHYRILCQPGKGGMSEVYLAEDTKLERQVVLKVLPASVRNHSDSLARFRCEALAASLLHGWLQRMS